VSLATRRRWLYSPATSDDRPQTRCISLASAVEAAPLWTAGRPSNTSGLESVRTLSSTSVSGNELLTGQHCKAQIPFCRIPRDVPFSANSITPTSPRAKGDVTSLSRTCRGRHGEVGIVEFGLKAVWTVDIRLKPNTHRRRRRDETVLSRRVGVGGVYWA